MRQVMMQVTDETGNLITGIETAQGMSRYYTGTAAFGDGFGHAGFEKSGEHRIDSYVR